MFDFSRATDAYRSKSQIAYVTTSVSMAFKPIPFSDDYQPKGNFILEELWKHLLEVKSDDSLFVPNSVKRAWILPLVFPGELFFKVLTGVDFRL